VASKCTPSAPLTSAWAPGRPFSIIAWMLAESIGGVPIRELESAKTWIQPLPESIALTYDVKIRMCHGNGNPLAQKRQRFQISTTGASSLRRQRHLIPPFTEPP
jgi:hypothetical protein